MYPQKTTHTRNTSRIVTTEDIEKSPGENLLLYLSMFAAIITFPFSLFVCLNILNEYQRVVIFRLGRLRKGGARGPGIVFILPCIDDFVRVDLRTASFDVPPQEILTRDSVTVQLDAVVFYRIREPLKAVIQVEYVRDATQFLAQTTLRNVAGTRDLFSLLAEREAISHSIEEILDAATESWGVKVERVEIKDIRLPIALQRAMAAEAEAGREAKAKIIAADGELKASRALKEASDIMSDNSIALQLRYLQTLVHITSERHSTIVFPFPIELLSSFEE